MKFAEITSLTAGNAAGLHPPKHSTCFGAGQVRSLMTRHGIRVLGTGATRPRSPPGRHSVDDPDLAAELQMPTTIYNWTCRGSTPAASRK
jgi:hypothetical protein